MDKLNPINMQVIVVSFGGVGTTFFMQHLSRFKRINEIRDKDRLKHIQESLITVNPDIRYVYIFGDPILSVISLFKRGMQYPQSHKLQRDSNIKLGAIPESMSLSEYALIRIDRFLFRGHFYGWYKNRRKRRIAFVRYENMWDNIPKLADFLEVPAAFENDFPAKTARTSTYDSISNNTLKGLQDMYGTLTNELRDKCDFEINQECGSHSTRDDGNSTG